MNKKNSFVTTTAMSLLLFSTSCFADTLTGTPATQTPTQVQASAPATTASTSAITAVNDTNKLQKIIDDFNAYATGIAPEIREEIRNYRLEIAKINKQKRELYKKLSQESQNYLAKEQDYKRQITLSKKNSAKATNKTVSVEDKSDKTDNK